MDESRPEVGTRKRPLQVSHLIIPKLQRAAVGFIELRARGLMLLLARFDETGFGLWIVGQFCPFGAPGLHAGLELSACCCGHFVANATLIGSKKGIALRYADFVCAGGHGRSGACSRGCGRR